MNPIALLAGAAAGGFGLYKALKKPGKGDFQVQNVVTPAGVPVKVVTPIPKTVTPAQRSTVPHAPPVVVPVRAAVPQVVAANGKKSTTFAPPAAITQVAPGKYEMAPIIVTPSGASSVAISSTLDVQRALNTLGFLPKLVEDGKLGPKTIANIKQFQSKSSLAADGNAGPATKAALSSALVGMSTDHPAAHVATAAAQKPYAPTKPVYSTKSQTELGPYDTAPNRAGATAGGVTTSRDVQHALNLLGASPPLAEDGAIGPKSVAAIKSFQLSHGLAADGVAGPKTKAALAAAVGMPVQAHGQFAGQFG